MKILFCVANSSELKAKRWYNAQIDSQLFRNANGLSTPKVQLESEIRVFLWETVSHILWGLGGSLGMRTGYLPVFSGSEKS